MRALEWVELPGPRLFFDRVIEILRNGQQAIVELPAVPRVDALSSLLERCRDQLVVSIWSDEAKQADPVPHLMRSFGLPGAERGVHSEDIYRMAEAPEAAGQIIIVECSSPQAVRRWGRFADDWARASAPRPLHLRSPLCLIAHGGLSEWRPAVPLHQEVLSWADAVDDLDMALYASRLLRSASTMSPCEERVATSVVAALAGPDHDVAQRLSILSLPEILAPAPVLNDMARQRGWSVGAIRAAMNWPGPFHQRYGGRMRLNPVALACLGRHAEIDGIVWSGQVAVLFPMIEECRRLWIREVASLLRVPHVTDYGRIDRIDDLEIGHIADQLRSATLRRAIEIRERAYRLRKLRNRLAHFEAVPETELREAELDTLLA